MRFIISELPYEQPLIKGLWRYEQDGAPTGAVESWRLSAAQDGYHFLRVDLDARAAPSGLSYLYHAVLDDRQQLVRLKYRFWQGSREVQGNVRLEPEGALFTSGQGSNRLEEAFSLPIGYCFWFPASTALGLLALSAENGRSPALTLSVVDRGASALLLPQVTELNKLESVDHVDGEGTTVVTLAWEGELRTITLDDQGWPKHMARQDGLQATETQRVTYQRI